MAKLLDVLLQRSQRLRDSMPPPKAVIGDIGHDADSLPDVYNALMAKPPVIFDQMAIDGAKNPNGYFMAKMPYNDPLHGGKTVLPGDREIGIQRDVAADPQEFLGTMTHELGHAVDRSRLPAFSTQPYRLGSMMQPRQIYDWARMIKDMPRLDAASYAAKMNTAAQEYRQHFMYMAQDMNHPNIREWFNKPEEIAADMLSDYMQYPSMLKGSAPQVAEYITQRLNADPYWAGKIDFKSVLPPVIGGGLALGAADGSSQEGQ